MLWFVQEEVVQGLFQRFTQLRTDAAYTLKPQERVIHLVFAIHAFQVRHGVHGTWTRLGTLAQADFRPPAQFGRRLQAAQPTMTRASLDAT